MNSSGILAVAVLLAVATLPPAAHGQEAAHPDMAGMPDNTAMPPMMDRAVFSHLVLDQLEGRAGGGLDFRWQGHAWIGDDYNKLWLTSEGFATSTGKIGDGQNQLLYGRSVSTWLDALAGVRTDLDSGTGRTWAALGVRGLAPMFIEYEATAYLSNEGHAAARLAVATDLLITQRLILRPELEANFYSETDPGRGVGAGLADIDAGLRLRYEIARQFAPYIGVAYAGRFGETARLAGRTGERAAALQFVFGIRAWI